MVHRYSMSSHFTRSQTVHQYSDFPAEHNNLDIRQSGRGSVLRDYQLHNYSNMSVSNVLSFNIKSAEDKEN